MKMSIFVLVIGLALISLGTSREWTSEEQDDWEENCYFRQCIDIKPEVLSYPHTQYPPKDSTIEKTYRKFARQTLLENVRLTADPDSYQLITKKKISKGDEFIVLDKKHYISGDTATESYKAGYTSDLIFNQFGAGGYPFTKRCFNSTWASLLHLYYFRSPLRPLVTAVDATTYPPYLQCQKQEINLLKGTTEYWDLLNHRGNWWHEYTTTFYR